MSKPTLVFVPGAWHNPEIYDQTMSILQGHGYPTIGLPLASVNVSPPHTSFDGDVKGIRDCLSNLVEGEGKHVILVCHSYSGMPASEAPVGLGKTEREEKGLSGGVVRMVFIVSFAMPEGFCPTSGGVEYPTWMKLEGDVLNVTKEGAKEVFYNDMSPEEGDKWAAKLRPQSPGVFTSTTTYAAWRYIPSTFVIATEDKTDFTPEFNHYMIDSARKQVATAFDQVETCNGGAHCLMLSHPDWLANVMRRAAGERV